MIGKDSSPIVSTIQPRSLKRVQQFSAVKFAMTARMPCTFSPHGIQGEAISPVPYNRWDLDRLSKSGKAVARPRFGGWLEEVDQFDSSMFGVSAPEAELMDPQQRLLLEAVWEAAQVGTSCMQADFFLSFTIASDASDVPATVIIAERPPLALQRRTILAPNKKCKVMLGCSFEEQASPLQTVSHSAACTGPNVKLRGVRNAKLGISYRSLHWHSADGVWRPGCRSYHQHGSFCSNRQSFQRSRRQNLLHFWP